MADERSPITQVPDSKVVSRTRISLVWVIPIVAAVIGAWVAVTRIEGEGPKITIVFISADGLEAGKTKIRYRGVDVGTITTILLSDDHRHVLATAQMTSKTEHFLVVDTQFWVVRPRISGANVTGLGTLLSGAYIGMEIGASRNEKRDFVALDTQPVVTGEFPGRFFVLKAADLGSLDTGTPVFFRRLQVGQVASYSLNQDGQRFNIQIFVRAPYDRFVTANSRFWQASGIDMQLSASGLSVQTQSLLSILIGGIAFATPASGRAQPAADANTSFTLFENRTEAFQQPAQNPQTYVVVFSESVRGLVPGAPVDFRGIKIGEVADIRSQIDYRTFKFSVLVTIRLDPRRFGIEVSDLKSGEDLATVRRRLINSLVAHGVRAQLRMGNLLTGAAFVSFDFFSSSAPASVDWSQNPPQLPTVPGQLEAVETSVGDLLKKLDKLPLQQIANGVQKTLSDLDPALVSARATLENASSTFNSATTILSTANGLVEPSSEQMEDVDQTLQEFRRAARSLRVLADYLEEHPEALIRGKPGKPQ
jgi:paraquat-inducible protein B